MRSLLPLLRALAPDPSLDRPILIAIAARVGKTRPIDDTVLKPWQKMHGVPDNRAAQMSLTLTLSRYR